MLRSLIDFFWSALRKDRIRVSPQEGRLLRLAPPCFLTVGRRTVRVVSRTVSETTSGPFVQYGCETEGGSAVLVIRLTPALRTDATWIEGGHEIALAESDVAVFQPVSRGCQRTS